MQYHISSSDLPSIKTSLRRAHPDLSASRRAEAAARGLGFATYAGLRQALTGVVQLHADDAAYCAYLGIPTVDERGEPDRALSRAIARAVLQRVLDEQDDLTLRGFDAVWMGDREELRRPLADRQQDLAERRREAYEDDWAADQFELAMIYLAQQRKTKALNRQTGSYGLKHRAEGLSRNYGLFDHLGNYVANGMLIAAAYASGFTVKRIGFTYNAYLNISMATVNTSRGWSGRTRSESRDVVLAMYASEVLAAASSTPTPGWRHCSISMGGTDAGSKRGFLK